MLQVPLTLDTHGGVSCKGRSLGIRCHVRGGVHTGRKRDLQTDRLCCKIISEHALAHGCVHTPVQTCSGLCSSKESRVTLLSALPQSFVTPSDSLDVGYDSLCKRYYYYYSEHLSNCCLLLIMLHISGGRAGVADSCGTVDLHPGEGPAGQTGPTQEIPGEDCNVKPSSGPIIDTVVKYAAEVRHVSLAEIWHCRVTALAATRPLVFQSPCSVKKFFLKIWDELFIRFRRFLDMIIKLLSTHSSRWLIRLQLKGLKGWIYVEVEVKKI